MEKMTEILKGLWIGSASNASDLAWLRSKGIKAIVNLANEVPDLYPNLFDYKKVSGTEDDQFSFLRHFDAVI